MRDAPAASVPGGWRWPPPCDAAVLRTRLNPFPCQVEGVRLPRGSGYRVVRHRPRRIDHPKGHRFMDRDPTLGQGHEARLHDLEECCAMGGDELRGHVRVAPL